MPVTPTDMYRSYTESAGKLCRQLAIISVALIWLFHNQSIDSENPLLTNLNCLLKFSFGFTFLSLFFDVLQEAIGSLLWYKEFKKTDNDDATKCSRPIYFANGCIILKLICMFTSYVLLGIFFLKTPMF
ncbi:hypothetical protein [Thalassotalea sediminis]|uniref:hypothetical protein n=1 Tax=Thalassotalea sediminis TaxID=1759089 RepID=UPI00257444B2|nr:hypothetical protein [Thalassotalea sediminis]